MKVSSADSTKSRILIIDDDNAILTSQQRLLERAGYEVRVAGGPYEGLDLTRDWHPDLVLLDLLMPTVTGFEAIHVFRKKPSTKDATLVAFSGVITDEEAHRFRRIGFDAVLPKPLAAADVLSRIGRLLAARADRNVA